MKTMRRVKQLNCLGIESTAHTFGASIVIDNGEICSDVREIYIPHHGRGIHPSEAAQHHNNKAHSVILKALKNAGAKTIIFDIFLPVSFSKEINDCLTSLTKFSCQAVSSLFLNPRGTLLEKNRLLFKITSISV